VPGEYAAAYAVGDNYSGHMVGSGPYTPCAYIPGQTVVLVRNPNWDPVTDPLRRRALVDRIQVRLGVSISSIQQAIDRRQAGLAATTNGSLGQGCRPRPRWRADS
jgi:ABC-type transport system substrate-binding protein